MGDIEIKLRDAVKKTFALATGQKHRIRLIRPKVFVLDVEDSHFNFDRKVLLPDLSSTDGSTPVLDTRRVTGLGVMFAALVHAKKNPSQGLFVTGHTDASGAVDYNQKLSDERAANVSLLLRGKRDDWRKLSAKDDAVDDVQTVLTWQSERAGWDCDPEGIDNKASESTHKAIRGFQERYNAEVAKAQEAGLDSPFKHKITADGNAGPETWGAFYDVYMTELMDLLDLDAFSALEQMQARSKPPAGMVDFVGCGEHIPFNPARRSPFEEGKDEHLEGPQRNPPDRRVEILFFDPGEEVDLVCHPKPGQCKPDQCPVYIKVPHRQVPIGIPKGLTMAEVNLRLTFVDPEGKIRPFPAGLPIQAKFGDPADDIDPPLPDAEDAPIIDADDGVDGSADVGAGAGLPAPAPGEEAPESMEVPQEPTATTGPNGALQFVVPRKASSLFLRLLAGGEKPFVTADPKDLTDTKLASVDELTNAVGQGRVFFQLPKELNTQQGYFDLPDAAAGVTFKDGAFLNFDNKQTQIGSREAPVELRLGIHWQHFKFEYFDRWTSSFTNVPQPRSKDAGGAAVQALALEGIGQLVETDTPAIRVEARSVWEVVSGKDTVHCLAWVRRETVKGQPRRDLADRWNGKDDINTAPGTFEIGAPATARGRYVAFLGRGDTKPPPKLGDPLPIGEVRISMIKSGRAFMAGSSAEGFWDLSRLAPDEGRFTAAHETGHIFSQQDEYLNTDDEPSYSQPNIGEKVRSSGAPYGLDRRAMMVNNFEVRARYFWDMLLFARARGHFRDAKALFVKHGPMTFSTDVTPLDQSRVRFPVAQQLGVAIPPFGLCDLFVYSTGHDEFTSGLDGSAAASPYDGFVMVRVKMAWRVPNTSAFDEIDKFMDRAMTSIRSTFNRKAALAIRARLGGKAVRLRVLFAPRLVCSTFPQGDGAAKYLGSIGDPPLPTPFKKEDYEKHTADVIGKSGVHVNVRIGEGTPGVSGASVPREGLVRDDKTILLIFTNSRFDDDAAAMFGQMVGVPFTRTGTVADYAGLLANLPPELTEVVPEIVP